MHTRNSIYMFTWYNSIVFVSLRSFEFTSFFSTRIGTNPDCVHSKPVSFFFYIIWTKKHRVIFNIKNYYRHDCYVAEFWNKINYEIKLANERWSTTWILLSSKRKEKKRTEMKWKEKAMSYYNLCEIYHTSNDRKSCEWWKKRQILI